MSDTKVSKPVLQSTVTLIMCLIAAVSLTYTLTSSSAAAGQERRIQELEQWKKETTLTLKELGESRAENKVMFTQIQQTLDKMDRALSRHTGG